MKSPAAGMIFLVFLPFFPFSSSVPAAVEYFYVGFVKNCLAFKMWKGLENYFVMERRCIIIFKERR